MKDTGMENYSTKYKEILIGLNWYDDQVEIWQFEEDDEKSWEMAKCVVFDEHFNKTTGEKPPVSVIRFFHLWVLTNHNHTSH